jgi:hypothetical protein
MTHKEEIQNQLNQMALYTIEKILYSANVPTEEGKIKLIKYVVGASFQTLPELEYNV